MAHETDAHDPVVAASEVQRDADREHRRTLIHHFYEVGDGEDIAAILDLDRAFTEASSGDPGPSFLAYFQALLLARASSLAAEGAVALSPAELIAIAKVHRRMLASIQTYREWLAVDLAEFGDQTPEAQRASLRETFAELVTLCDAVQTSGLPAARAEVEVELLLHEACIAGLRLAGALEEGGVEQAAVLIDLGTLEYQLARLMPEARVQWYGHAASNVFTGVRVLTDAAFAGAVADTDAADWIASSGAAIAAWQLTAHRQALIDDWLTREVVSERTVVEQWVAHAARLLNGRDRDGFDDGPEPGTGRSENCQRAVVCGLAWSSGVPIPMGPLSPGSSRWELVRAAHEEAYGGAYEPCASAGAVAARMREVGAGAKGIVSIDRYPKAGHVLVVENVGGRIYFLEYQVGTVIDLDADGKHLDGEGADTRYALLVTHDPLRPRSFLDEAAAAERALTLLDTGARRFEYVTPERSVSPSRADDGFGR
jgi:hypothetical protein